MMEKHIEVKENSFQAVHTSIENINFEGEEVLKVTKADKIMEFDENTYAKLKEVTFHNGVIEVKVLSRLLPDAPEFARGFIGIAYRISEDDQKFEAFYVRPTNGRINDPVRRAHGCQYFSYPKYTFAYFRDHNITQYEAPVDIGLNEWITIKAVIHDDKAQFYINNDDKPVLEVDDMKHGAKAKGAIGFFVDIGTEGYFKDLKISLSEYTS